MKKWWELGVALMCAGLVSGCASHGTAIEADAPEVVEIAPDGDPYLSAEELRAQLRDIAREISDEYGGRLGIAVTDGEDVVQVGLSGNSWAWSTIKVPVAVVADREGVATEELIVASISSSDNDAAYYLSAAIDMDLGDLGHVPELEPLPGETPWSLVEQARFAAELPCVDEIGTTWDAMGDIVEWQDYGLGQIPGTHFKGGWGQDTPRVYTLRQLGAVPVDGGTVGIAVITHPDDADHDTATLILDEVGLRLAGLIHDIAPGTTCTR